VFTEQDGKTTVTLTMRFESTEARDAALASGMESWIRAACNKLDELLVAYV